MTDNKKQDPLSDASLLTLYVKPHTKKSREVKGEDLKTIIDLYEKMQKLCHTPRGIYPAAFAVAHCQINDTDPLRFYVTHDGIVIINPIITRHSESTKTDIEGCLSFPNNMPVAKERWYKLEMDFITIEKDKDGKHSLSAIRKAHLKGIEARIAQHENDHLEGINIYELGNYQEDVIIKTGEDSSS